MGRIGVIVFTVLALTGCASSQHKALMGSTEALLKDSAFSSKPPQPIETQTQIFALSAEAKEFVSNIVVGTENKRESIALLSNAIFDRAYLGLIYDNSATAIASDTFRSRAANCLSMTIMTYSMARYADLQAQFISVDVPEYWTRRSGFSLINGHVNLKVRIDNRKTINHIKPVSNIIDFDPQDIRRYFKRTPVTKNHITALFYNNKAADALINEHYDLAYHYLKAAAKYAPSLDDTWVNLGVLYRFAGEYDMAEQAYNYALRLENDNYTAKENMAVLYRMTGREAEAEKLMQKVVNARRKNPFYHFILGEEARANNEYAEALGHYRRAIRLDDTKHEVFYGMGYTLLMMGDVSKAKFYLTKAARVAPNENEKSRYLSKLSALQTTNNER